MHWCKHLQWCLTELSGEACGEFLKILDRATCLGRPLCVCCVDEACIDACVYGGEFKHSRFCKVQLSKAQMSSVLLLHSLHFCFLAGPLEGADKPWQAMQTVRYPYAVWELCVNPALANWPQLCSLLGWHGANCSAHYIASFSSKKRYVVQNGG